MTTPPGYDLAVLFAIIAGAVALAGFAAAGILDGIDAVRDRLDRRRNKAAAEHAAALDAFRRAAAIEPETTEPYDPAAHLAATVAVWNAELAEDAAAQAAATEPDELTRAYRDHISHTIGRHALDALDGLEADGLDPETDGLALARAIAAAIGQPLD